MLTSELVSLAALAVSVTAVALKLWDTRSAALQHAKAAWDARAQRADAEVEVLRVHCDQTMLGLDKRIVELDRLVAVIALQVSVFWRGVGVNAGMTLHSSHTPALDALLEQFFASTLTPAKITDIRARLKTLANDAAETPERQSMAREVLLALHVLYEPEGLHPLGHDIPTLFGASEAPE